MCIRREKSDKKIVATKQTSGQADRQAQLLFDFLKVSCAPITLCQNDGILEERASYIGCYTTDPSRK